MGHEVGHYVTVIYIYRLIDLLVSLTYNLNTVKCIDLKCKFNEFKCVCGAN